MPAPKSAPTSATKGKPRAAKTAVRSSAVARLSEGYLPHALSRLMNALNLRLAESLRPLDMTTQQFRVMQVLFIAEVASIGAIAEDAVIEQSVVSRIVDQLEKRDFVRRRKRETNARVVEVSLTPVGLAVFNALMPHANAIVDDATSVLSEADRTTLLDLLSRVLGHVRAGRKVARSAGRSASPRIAPLDAPTPAATSVPPRALHQHLVSGHRKQR